MDHQKRQVMDYYAKTMMEENNKNDNTDTIITTDKGTQSDNDNTNGTSSDNDDNNNSHDDDDDDNDDWDQMFQSLKSFFIETDSTLVPSVYPKDYIINWQHGSPNNERSMPIHVVVIALVVVSIIVLLMVPVRRSDEWRL